MIIQYLEGEFGDIKETLERDYTDNFNVRIGEKIKLNTKLCEIIDIVHYPKEYEYRIDVFVKVIQVLPESFWDKNLLEIFKKK